MKHLIRIQKATGARALCLVLLCALLPLSACAVSRQKAFTFSYFDYFDTYCSLTLYARDRQEAQDLANTAEEIMAQCHRLFDRYHTYEGVINLCSLNQAAGGAPLTVDPLLYDFLAFGKEMALLTGGQTNFAMGSVLALWHDAREAAQADPHGATLPDLSALRQAAEHTDPHAVTLGEQYTVQLTDPLLSLDAGALGKGFAANQIQKALLEAGCSDFLINLGGNVLGIGQKEDGTPWLCAIDEPAEGIGFPDAVALADQSLVTTGANQRYYTVDGEEYGHVIDPDTLMPPRYALSVSVLCADSALADALSTALFCMTPAEGLALVERYDAAEALWLLADGTIQESSGFSLAAVERAK